MLKGTNGTNIFHHPVKDSEQTAGRSVECIDCHNPHKARPDNRHAGATGVDLAGNAVGPGTMNNRDVTQYEVCFKCHGDSYNTTRTRTTNTRLDFNTTATNSGYHPVTQAGRGASQNLTDQLRGGLTPTSTIKCSDCHNSDATSGTAGPVVDSAALTQGAHGSTNATILRARNDVREDVERIDALEFLARVAHAIAGTAEAFGPVLRLLRRGREGPTTEGGGRGVHARARK
jgi:hypothetical protein